MSEEKQILTSKRVEEIFLASMYDESDVEDDAEGMSIIPDGALVIEGVIHTVAFKPARLAVYKEEIGRLLRELPDDFHWDKGAGHSFLNAVVDRHGNHWAEHRNVEQLLVLGIATRQAQLCLARALWSVLPGNLPYFRVGDIPDDSITLTVPTASRSDIN